MVFDSARLQAVLFGGASAQTVYSDTWTWDGFNWTLKSTPKTFPPARKYRITSYNVCYTKLLRMVQFIKK